jgi:ABC-2 type transport system ATP-binding protein
MNKLSHAIDVEGINKSFNGKRVVDDLSIKVKYGQIYGFLGPNGSGKTTTIRILCGLLTPDSAQGTCLGYDIIKEAALIKKQVGYMTQKFSYYEDLTVEENLEFVSRVYNISNRKEKIKIITEKLGLIDRRKQLTGELSGGLKQRLALAACMLHEPKLLLLDEPTAGVDPKARREFWDQIHDLAASGITVLVSTHYMDEAERCHEVAYIAYGKLITKGSVEQVITSSELTTWNVSGEGLALLVNELRGKQGIEMLAPFGNSLHISGVDAEALRIAIAPHMNNTSQKWVLTTPNLEDVFIHLLAQVKSGAL